MMYVKLHFNQIYFKNGGKRFEVCQNLVSISVASHFHVYENKDAVYYYVPKCRKKFATMTN
jgi:hypothetical protein